MKKLLLALALLLFPFAANAMTALVTVGSQSYSFDSANGVNVGTYTDPEGQFIQDNVLTSRTDTPIEVSFRTDRNSSRFEIVLDNFRAFGPGNAAAANIGPLTVSIDGAAPVSVPGLNWATEWRWQSSPRPIRHTIEQLIAAHAVLPRMVLSGSYPIIDWATAAFYKGMDTTGGRRDIGIDTEWAANAILTKDPVALAGVVALAETAEQMPMHVRDETTGGPVDFIAHPDIDWYWQAGYSHPTETWVKFAGNSGWTLDYAHFPNVSSLAFLLTGDPYFLEQLNYRETWAMGFNGVRNDANGVRLIYEDQPRGWAWTLRDLFWLVKLTPSAGAGWLKSQAYWRTLLDANRARFTTAFVNDPALAKWGSGPWNATYGFQDDFVTEAIGLGVYLGFSEWAAAYDFKLVGLDARTNGTSGWPRQVPGPYYAALGPARPGLANYGPGFVWYNSWADAWNGYANDKNPDGTSVNGIPPQPWANSTDYPLQSGYSYMVEVRNDLAIATLNGRFAGKDNLAFIQHMTDQVGLVDASRSVSPTLGAAQSPPLPPRSLPGG